MLGVSTGQLLVILGACSVMMKPSDMIKMARVAGRMTGRAVGRLMIYRRQMDDIFEQTAAKKINTELQDAMSKLQSIGYEVQNLSRITPGQFIKRQHNTEGTAEAGTYDGSATKPGEFRDEIRSMIRDEIESFCRKNPDQFTRRLDNPDGIQNSEKTAEATKFDVTDKFSMATSKDMESANTSSTNLHSQAMMYARLSESPGIKMSSSTSVSYGEHFKESNGRLNVLPISAESAGLLPNRTVASSVFAASHILYLSFCLPDDRDAEHPMDITMTPPSSSQAPSGPVTRARAHAIETNVTSFFFELPMHSYET